MDDPLKTAKSRNSRGFCENPQIIRGFRERFGGDTVIVPVGTNKLYKIIYPKIGLRRRVYSAP